MTKVLRASEAGFPCERNVWYRLNDESRGEPDVRTQRIFDVGTCLEPLIVEWLRTDGWEVEYNAGSQDAPLEIVLPVAGGELRGHPDCFMSRGDVRNVIADIKTMNERSFREWRRNGTLKSKPQYADQLHIYAAGCLKECREIEHLAIVGVNKNNSDMYIDMFDYDASRMAAIKERSERILSIEIAPEEGSPRESWCCGYCEYAGECPQARRSPVCREPSTPASTGDVEIVEAMRMLKEARDLSKLAKEQEMAAKEMLDAYVQSSGQREVIGGGLTFRLMERETSRFDTTLFKKEHPELLWRYMKSSRSVLYEVKENADNDDA